MNGGTVPTEGKLRQDEYETLRTHEFNQKIASRIRARGEGAVLATLPAVVPYMQKSQKMFYPKIENFSPEFLLFRAKCSITTSARGGY